jgi:hypothetical protein
MYLSSFWEDMLVLWAVCSALIIILATLKQPRSFKNTLAGLGISAGLPLLVAIIIVAMPFTISHKRKKLVEDKKQPGHPLRTIAGKPGAIIKKYLVPDKHQGGS